MLEASVIVPTRGPPRLPARRARVAGRPGPRPRLATRCWSSTTGPPTATREVARARSRGAPARRSATSSARACPGLNSARNTASRPPDRAFVVFVDDDVEAPPGWLRELRRRPAPPPASTSSSAGRSGCGSRDRGCRCAAARRRRSRRSTAAREDREIELVWGANMAIDRSAFELAGTFDAGVPYGFDEDMWERRLRARRRPHHVRRARRPRPPPRLAATRGCGRCARGLQARPQPARLQSSTRRGAEPAPRELRVLAGCVFHIFRYRCGNGILLTRPLRRAACARRCARMSDEPSPTLDVDGCSRARAASSPARGRAARARVARPRSTTPRSVARLVPPRLARAARAAGARRRSSCSGSTAGDHGATRWRARSRAARSRARRRDSRSARSTTPAAGPRAPTRARRTCAAAASSRT